MASARNEPRIDWRCRPSETLLWMPALRELRTREAGGTAAEVRFARRCCFRQSARLVADHGASRSGASLPPGLSPETGSAGATRWIRSIELKQAAHEAKTRLRRVFWSPTMRARRGQDLRVAGFGSLLPSQITELAAYAALVRRLPCAADDRNGLRGHRRPRFRLRPDGQRRARSSPPHRGTGAARQLGEDAIRMAASLIVDAEVRASGGGIVRAIAFSADSSMHRRSGFHTRRAPGVGGLRHRRWTRASCANFR